MKGLILTTFALGLCGFVFRPDFSVSEPVRLRIVADKVRAPIRHARDETARAWGIEPRIFRAVELVESSGRIDAIRFEPHLMKRAWTKPGAGWTRRQLSTSYGPMQVLGVNYRAKGLLPAHTTDVKINYDLAAAYLAGCKARRGNWRGALLCYNGSGNPQYPVRVARVAISLGLKSKNG